MEHEHVTDFFKHIQKRHSLELDVVEAARYQLDQRSFRSSELLKQALERFDQNYPTRNPA